jgi:defect in organelle trafficking protein DotC
MKKYSIIKKTNIAILLSSIFFNSYANEDQKASHDGADDIKKILINNTELSNSDFIIKYYKKKGASGKISMGQSYDLQEPMTMSELYNLEHPYFLGGGTKNMSLKELNKKIIEKSSDDIKGLRKNSVYNEALMIGVQNALFKVLYDFRNDLEIIGSELERIFNFKELMLADGKVIPPVILEDGSGIEKEGNLKLRIKDAGFKIYKQAKVTLHAPTYYQYLNFEPIKPKEPEDLLLPINDEERKLWEAGGKKGWILGIKQGNSIINEGLSSLLRDYIGMSRFHLMKDSGIISMPSLERLNIGTTTDGNNLNVGEITFEVTILPKFNANTTTWEALPQVDDFLFQEEF